MRDAKPEANEFFYLDSAGNKQDAELHNPILRAVDFPIDEKVMKPIRERNRANWLAEQGKQAAKQKAAQIEARRRSQWQRAKARAQALLAREFDESQHPRDEGGKFTESGGGGDSSSEGSPSPHAKDPTSASSLLRIEKNVTKEDLYKKVPGSKEQDAAAREKLKGEPDTQKLYKLPSGNYAPDRLPTHAAIINRLMKPEQIVAAIPKRGEKPTLYILGGRGGSGKGWFTGKKGTLAGVKAVYINNDDVKAELPEFKGFNAGPLHEEASDIADKMEKYARNNRLNIVVDATLKSEESLAKRIAVYKAAGYKISGHYMYASPATAAERALGRFVSGNKKDGKGRFVPPEYSLGSKTNEHTFDNHRDQMDHWEVYDNMGSSPKFHSRKGG